MIVYTPKKKFRGTVYVEWLNVSGTVDASPDWAQSHLEVARQRAAVRSKFLLEQDAKRLNRAARTSEFGSPSGAFVAVSVHTLDRSGIV